MTIILLWAGAMIAFSAGWVLGAATSASATEDEIVEAFEAGMRGQALAQHPLGVDAALEDEAARARWETHGILPAHLLDDANFEPGSPEEERAGESWVGARYWRSEEDGA